MAAKSRHASVSPINRMTTCGRRECSSLFAVCGGCDRGRRYCGDRCAEIARRAQTRRAGKCYQSGARGRLLHAARQARYRDRLVRVTHQPAIAKPISLKNAHEISVSVPDGHQQARGAPSPAFASVADAPCSRVAPHCTRCGRAAAFVRTQHVGRARRSYPAPPVARPAQPTREGPVVPRVGVYLPANNAP